MRLFEHFPQSEKTKCPICGTDDDKPCFLMPIQGTENGNICEAAPTHASCISERLNEFIYNKEMGVIYMRVGQ
jgi:hypothetical protein